MSKREARIERKLEKLVHEQEKNARLVAKVESDTEPRIAVQPNSPHAPRAEQDPGSIMKMRMEYRIHEHADRIGSWSWGQARDWCNTSAYGPEKANKLKESYVRHPLGKPIVLWHSVLVG